MREPHWPHFHASGFWPLSTLIPALASVCVGGCAGIQTLLHHWGDGRADGKAGASAACLPGIEPSGPPAPANTPLPPPLLFFFLVFCVPTQGMLARLHLISPALPPCLSVRCLAFALLASVSVTFSRPSFPPRSSSLSSRRTHARTHTTTHARTHARTHTHTHTHTHRRTGR